MVKRKIRPRQIEVKYYQKEKKKIGIFAFRQALANIMPVGECNNVFFNIIAIFLFLYMVEDPYDYFRSCYKHRNCFFLYQIQYLARIYFIFIQMMKSSFFQEISQLQIQWSEPD